MDKLSGGHAHMMHLANGHPPLRHTASYDGSYTASPPLHGTHPTPPPVMMGQCYDNTNSEYYRHCHEEKYKPPP